MAESFIVPEEELRKDIFLEKISLSELLDNVIKEVQLLNQEYKKEQYNPTVQEGHNNIYFKLDAEGKQYVRRGYTVVEKLREKITGEIIFYINQKEKVIKKPFDFSIVTRYGEIGSKVKTRGINMGQIPESTSELNQQLKLNDNLYAQEIINNRLKTVQNCYKESYRTYYTVYGQKEQANESENEAFPAANLNSLKKGEKLLDIYKEFKERVGKQKTGAARWAQFSGSSYGYINKDGEVIKQLKQKAIGQLFAIRKISDKVYVTSLGGKNQGHLLEAQLHAASLLQTEGKEDINTVYDTKKVISLDEALIRASGNTPFYKGGDVTFKINGQFFTFQVKGIRGEVKIQSIINAIRKINEIFIKNSEIKTQDILEEQKQEEIISALKDFFTVEEKDTLDFLQQEMQKKVFQK